MQLNLFDRLRQLALLSFLLCLAFAAPAVTIPPMGNLVNGVIATAVFDPAWASASSGDLLARSLATPSYSEKTLLRAYLARERPETAEGLCCRAWIIAASDYKNPEIERLYKKSISLQPKLGLAINNLASYYQDIGNTDQQIKVYEAGIPTVPDYNNQCMVQYAYFAYKAQGGKARASDFLQRMKQRFGEGHFIFALIAAIEAADANRASDAIPAMKAAIDNGPVPFDLLSRYLDARLNQAQSSGQSAQTQMDIIGEFVELSDSLSTADKQRALVKAASLLKKQFGATSAATGLLYQAATTWPATEMLSELTASYYAYSQDRCQLIEDAIAAANKYNPTLYSALAFTSMKIRWEPAKTIQSCRAALAYCALPSQRTDLLKSTIDYLELAGDYDGGLSLIQSDAAGFDEPTRTMYSYYNRLYAGALDLASRQLDAYYKLGKTNESWYQARREQLDSLMGTRDRGADADPVVVSGEIYANTAFSADGRLAATGSTPMNLWDLASQRKICTLGLGSKFGLRAFSGNGAYIASAISQYYGDTVLSALAVYETASGKAIFIIPESSEISSLCWSPDDKRLAAIDFTGMVRVYDRATGKQTGAFRSGPISISGAMTWLPQGLIATGVAQDSVVRVWSDRSFELLRELPNVSWPHAMSSSSDGKYLVCSDNRRITTVWTTTDWKARTVKTTMWPKQLFARPGSHEILLNDAGNSKEQLGLLDLDTMTMKAATTGNSYIQAGFSAQGIVIAKNHSFTWLDPATLAEKNSLYGMSVPGRAMYGVPEAGLAILQDGMGLQYFDVATGQKKRTEYMESISFSIPANGQTWLLVNKDDGLYRKDAVTGAMTRLCVPGISVQQVQYVEGTLWLAGMPKESEGSGTQNAAVEAWALSGPTRVASLRFPLVTEPLKLAQTATQPEIAAFAVTPDQKSVVAVTRWQDSWGTDPITSKYVRVFRPSDGSMQASIKLQGSARSLASDAADQCAVVIGNFRYTYRLSDAKNLKTENLGIGTIIPANGKIPETRWGAGFISQGNTQKRFPYNLVGVAEYADKNLLVAYTSENQLYYYEASTLDLLSTLYLRNDDEWLLFSPGGGYAASANGTGKAFVRLNGKLSGLELNQFYTTLYRPDLTSPMAGRKADQGKTADSLVAAGGLPPRVDILSPSAGDSAKNETTVRIRVSDQGGGIGRIILYNGDLPVCLSDSTTRGMKQTGSVTPKTGGETREYEALFTLRPGENRISAMATNKAGNIESQRPVVTVKYTGGSTVQPSLYLLEIAVQKYRDKDLQLKYSVNDAEAMKAALQAQAGKLYQKVMVKTLYDSEVTKSGFAKAFDDLSAQVSADDIFVLYFAGHGVTNDADGEYYFLPYDFRYNGADSIAGQCISKDLIMQNLVKIPAQKSLLLFDTCNSGSFLTTKAGARGIGEKTAVDRLKQAVGRAMIVASNDTQVALEGLEGHGVFTYALLKGLGGGAQLDSKGFISLKSLAAFVENQVPDLTYERWGYEQVPQSQLPREDFPIFKSVSIKTPPVESPKPSPAATPQTATKAVWEPKIAFDGRLGPVMVKNGALYDIYISFWHPDSKVVFSTVQFPAQKTTSLLFDGKVYNYGGDWGIQIGGQNAKVVNLKDVADWVAMDKTQGWLLDPDKYNQLTR